MSIRLADEMNLAMIRDEKRRAFNAASEEPVMPQSRVLNFDTQTGAMSIAEGLDSIARLRRQLDRFDVALPGAKDMRIDSETEAKIRAICDELEAEMHDGTRAT
jgi:hypothetical protein